MSDLIVALVTDTHIRPRYDDGQLAFPSDERHNERNRVAAEAIRAMNPDLVVHLGDVVHPIPTLPAHADALEVAEEIYGDLGAPMVLVPGNHDVGDKHASAYAPEQVDETRKVFAQTWGAPFQSFDSAGIHFVIIDGGLLGVDSDEGAAQWAWLEDDLRTNEARCFVFMHYPPFLTEPEEDEHYDNLEPVVRTRLLGTLVDSGVEAVFSGHVHQFFLNHRSGVDLISLPSVAFTRPEYSFLRPTAPADAENGRDDLEQMGVGKLTISDTGYRLEIVRIHSRAPGPPAPSKPLGVWLRHRLGRRSELPYGDLDALDRKVARDEAALVQVLDLGLSWVRVPLTDLTDHDVRFRLDWLKRHRVSSHFFSRGVPTAAQRALYAQYGGGSDWELVIRDQEVAALVEALADGGEFGFIVGRIGKSTGAATKYFSHFPREGFHPSHTALEALAEAGASGIAFRIAAEGPVDEQVGAAVERAEQLGVRAICHVELPFGSEAMAQTDDRLVEQRVLAAAQAGWRHPEARFFLDMLADKDRGYWCRNALVDLGGRPRAAYRALKSLAPADQAPTAWKPPST